MVFLFFLDDEVAADSEVDDGGGDVAHVDGIVDQSADFSGSELIGRLLVGGDGAKARIAAAGPPPPEHEEERGDWDEEGPVAAEIEEEAGERRGFADGALVEGNGKGEPLMHGQRLIGMDVDTGAGDFDGSFVAGGAVG